MKVALVHDYIKEYGGAERVLETLHEIYPDATVFTSLYLPQYLGPHAQRFAGWNIQTSFLQRIPLNAKLISIFRLISPFVFHSFNLSDYDVVIVSATGAYFPNNIHKKNNHQPLHICYCHTPPRYLYGYATAREWKKNLLFRIAGEVANHVLRIVDYHISQRVDYYIANSQEVAGRIQKFYRREAMVIYPPVDIVSRQSLVVGQEKKRKTNDQQQNTYYLTGGRLARPKHVDLIVKVCAELGLSLRVFGKAFAGYGEELHSLADGKKESFITFVGEVSDEEKYELMAGAKAFLFASEDEDFGITPVEAMSMGLPVIAYRSGGVQESVIGDKTGIFFDSLTMDSLTNAIKRFEKLMIKPEDCRKQAEKFGKERFIKEMQEFVDEKIKEKI